MSIQKLMKDFFDDKIKYRIMFSGQRKTYKIQAEQKILFFRSWYDVDEKEYEDLGNARAELQFMTAHDWKEVSDAG